jgi:hypothetical protein
VGMTDSMAGCVAGGAKAGHHGHSCPHLGSFALAAAPVALPQGARASQIAPLGQARFDSIVLDVPLPPPTPGA